MKNTDESISRTNTVLCYDCDDWKIYPATEFPRVPICGCDDSRAGRFYALLYVHHGSSYTIALPELVGYQ
jgi:hypothetical protein